MYTVKKFLLFFLVLIISFATSVYSDALAEGNGVGTWIWQASDNAEIDTNGAFDTLLNASDSSELATNVRLEKGWRYILSRDAITGTGSDSIAIDVRVYAYDQNNNIIYYTSIDSITAAAGEQIEIPFGSTFGGSQFHYSIRLFSYTGNGTQVILNRFYLDKRKAYVVSPTSYFKY